MGGATTQFRLFLAVITVVLVSSDCQVLQGVTYSLTDLGFLPGANASLCNEVNEVGQVAGWSGFSPGGITHGFVWQNGTMTDIGDLPGGVDNSLASDINDLGQVAGESLTTTGLRGVLWQNGTMTDLGDLPGGEDFSSARAINNAGQIVGESGGPSGGRGFIWQNGVMTDLGTFPGGTSNVIAVDINNQGQVVGTCGVINSDHGFIWQNGIMTDLGDLPGGSNYSAAAGINGLGHVVGRSIGAGTNDWPRAVLWKNGSMIELGTIVGTLTFCEAEAINDVGQIVGFCEVSTGTRALIWDGIAQPLDLNNLLDSSGDGWVLNYAFDINNNGQIIGYGKLNGGMPRSFLLTPVPEPSAFCLIICGVGVLYRFCRAKLDHI
jgi:probable HAF family extracellular repeat protein